MKTYAAVFLGSLIVALGVTPVVGWLARLLNIVDQPGTRRIHRRPIPRMGGVAIVVAFVAGALPVLLLDSRIGEALRQVREQVVWLMAAGSLIAAVGLVDDARSVRAGLRFLIHVLAASAVWQSGIRIESISAAGLGPVKLGLLSWPLTVLWIVGMTNAVNLIDGLDGLAAGIGAVTALVIALFSIWTDQLVTAVLMLALLGSLCGFLVFNFNPARIFMGDCGSTFLGFFLASTGVLAANGAGNIVGVALPALALGVPIFDTLFSMLRRFLERRSLFAADRNHLHHRLLKHGLAHRSVVLVIHGTTAVAAGLGMIMMITRGALTIIVFATVCVLLVMVFHLAGSVRLRESVQKLRENLRLASENKKQQKVFEDAQLRIREAETFDAWWGAVCSAAKDMGVSRVSLKIVNHDGTSKFMVWEREGGVDPERTVCTTVPIRQRSDLPALQAQVDVPVNGSLESAGLRMNFFSRLIDEHSVDGLLDTEKRPRAEVLGPGASGGSGRDRAA